MDLAVIAIAQQIRRQDYRGDFHLSLAEAVQLIFDYGRQEYNRGADKARDEQDHN